MSSYHHHIIRDTYSCNESTQTSCKSQTFQNPYDEKAYDTIQIDEAVVPKIESNYEESECENVTNMMFVSCSDLSDLDLEKSKLELKIKQESDESESQYGLIHLDVDVFGSTVDSKEDRDDSDVKVESSTVATEDVLTFEPPALAARDSSLRRSVCYLECSGPQSIKEHFPSVHNDTDHLCRVCCQTFANKDHLKKHIDIHDGKGLSDHLHSKLRAPPDNLVTLSGSGSFCCSSCGQSFASDQCLKGHSSTHSTEGSPSINREDSLQQHSPVRGDDEKPFPCSVCQRLFMDAESLQDHMNIHDRQIQHPCPVCTRSFSNVGNLKKHVSAHDTDNGPFTCSICKRIFAYKSTLIRHNITHTNERPFTCAVCARGFTRKHILRRHVLSHHVEKPFSCTVCGRSFHEKADMESHKSVHDVFGVENPFPCTMCSRAFSKEENLNEHIKNHADETPFSCSVCAKSFAKRSNLRRHAIIHEDARPFSCSVCGRSFNQRGELTRHTMIHKNERPYTCSVCNWSFVQKCTLQRHIRIHTKEKPFTCTVCFRSFARKHLLKNHLVVHGGEKPFSCHLCNRAFTETSGLKRHMLTHDNSKNKPYSCRICRRYYAEKRTLNKHMRSHDQSAESPSTAFSSCSDLAEESS